MKKVAGFFVVCIAIGLVFNAVYPQRLRRAVLMSTLFQGFDMTDEFADMKDLFPHREVRTSNPTTLATGELVDALPTYYEFEGEKRNVQRLLAETETSGLLVMRDGQIIHEEYALGSSADTRWISWSVAKSFVSAMIGIAVDDGRVDSIRDPITKYVPELIGSAYDGVEIEDILEMSSGASWNEDYGDPASDITRFGASIVFGYSQDEFVSSLSRDREPGTFNRYNSTDTQALGMLLVRVTGKTLAAYTEETIWKPMQMERDAYWITDEPGMELAFGGLNVTLRDYARFGEMYRMGGRWNGKQIVPEAWVKASTVPSKPHLQPGDQPGSDSTFGYGYQWWMPPSGDEGEYSAIGVYNQFIYVNPTYGIVIAKTSANQEYGRDESTDREIETLALFNAIAHSVGRAP